MSSIAEHLEKIFYDLPVEEECTELVQLLSLDNNELENKFSSNPVLWEKYKFNQLNIVKNIEELDTESDTSEENFPIRMNKEEQEAKTSMQGGTRNKRKEPMGEYWGKDRNHQGIPFNEGTSRQTAINTINIDCIYDLEERKTVINPKP